jgi:hypothetical protein
MNIRTVILAVVLVLILLFAAQLVTAKTEDILNPSPDPVSVTNDKVNSASQNPVPVLLYRTRFDVCFDVPLREAAACRAESQTLVPADRPRLDECFDVSLSELASCRNANQVTAP